MAIEEKIENIKEYWYLGIEMKELQEELKEIQEQGFDASQKTERYALKLSELEGAIGESLTNICEKRLKIEGYINDIDNAEIRLLLRLRYMRGFTWQRIGDELFMTKQGVYQKYKRYIKSTQSA